MKTNGQNARRCFCPLVCRQNRIDMACPKCGCKETYESVEDDVLGLPDDHERCAACGHIFYFEDHADEDDEDGWSAFT